MSIVIEPGANTGVGDFCISKFLEMSEDLLSFFLLGSFAGVVEIICDVNTGHCQFWPKGITGLPLRKILDAEENLNRVDLFVFEEPAIGCWWSPMTRLE